MNLWIIIIDSGWFEQRESITSVVFDDSFAGCSTLTSTAFWFWEFKNLTSITGIKNLKTENVDFMSNMFYGCSGLTTIYAGKGWSTAKVMDSRDMFAGCTGLVGGAGTKFDACNIDHTYARIDGGSDNPGYFTRKAGDTGEWAEGDLNHDGKLDAADIVHLTNLILNQK